MITAPTLTISPEKVCWIIMKAREFDVQDASGDVETVDSEDENWSALEPHRDDPTRQEIASFVRSLNLDEQIDLVALVWLGRGDGSLAEWEELRAEATRTHTGRTASYLLGKPMLPDHLEDALEQFGCSCDDYDLGHF